MSRHLKIYDDYFDVSLFNPRRCELTGLSSPVEIHHIDARGMGGRKSMDNIDNLMALTKELHYLLGDKKQWKDFLRDQHQIYMETRIPLYERDKKQFLSFRLRLRSL